MAMELFSPFNWAATAVSASSVTASGALTLPTAPFTASVRIYNACATAAFVAFGISTITATTSSLPIPAGAVETFEVSPSATHAAVILASGTGTVYFTPGRGA